MRYMLIFLLAVFLVLVRCSATKPPGVIRISPQAVGNMPDSALTTDYYIIRIDNVIDSVEQHDPKSYVGDGDTLHVWFNYRGPDLLPTNYLPSNQGHTLNVPNTDDLWDIDNDANIYWKNWVVLDPGQWQARITSYNQSGFIESGRYDFMVTGNKPAKVYWGGL